MKQNWLHKTIAFLFAVVITFPFLIQGIHALEQHEHIICLAEAEQHFHADEPDCTICHFQVKNNYFDFSSNCSLEKVDLFYAKFEKIEQSNYVVDLISKKTRGPPYFII